MNFYSKKKHGHNNLTLCFVADDYGENMETNIAIAKMCDSSIVRSVTVIASSNSVYSDLFLKPDEKVTWGIHLYLTQYRLLTAKLQAFTVSNKKMPGKRNILLGLMTGRISRNEIFNEFDMQICRLRKLGCNPTFIDTHQNIHGLPFIFSIVKQVATKYGLENKVRPFAQLNFNLKHNWKTISSGIYSAAVNFHQRSIVLVDCPGYNKEKINKHDALYAWNRFLSNIKPRGYHKIIIPCHPGMSPAEISLYFSDEFREIIKSHRVSLASFA